MTTEGDYGIGSNHWPGLAKLLEEMGELTAELSKLMAMGGDADTSHWDGGGPLRPRITEEMGDVRASMIFFAEQNDLPKLLIHARADEKLKKFRFWQNQQRSEENPDG